MLEAQQRELEKTTVLAQCKLGELTQKMQIARGRNDGGTYVRALDIGKQEQLERLGLSRQRANEYEKMAAHPEIVQQVIDSGKPAHKDSGKPGQAQQKN